MRKLLIVVALTVLVPSAAWATVTEVQNTDDPTRHPYQVTVVQGGSYCGIGQCGLLLPTITSGRTLVQHVSCYFEMSTGGTVLWANITDAEQDSNFLPITLTGTSAGVGYYTTNADTYLFLKKGDQLLATVDTAGEGIVQFQCTASGYYL